MGRRLPLADTALVETIRSQQAWVTGRFPDTPREALWLLPRANKNATDGHTCCPSDPDVDAVLGNRHPPPQRRRNRPGR